MYTSCKKTLSALLLLTLIFYTLNSNAEVRLPKLISNNMVLQRDIAIPIWGWGSAGEKIEVDFNGKRYKSVTDASGKWKLNLRKTKAGGPYNIIIKGSNTITLNNILIGDVWLCSGQSNMELKMLTVKEKYAADIEIGTNNQIRHFMVNKASSVTVQDTIASPGWMMADPTTIPSFSAVAYFFAKTLFDKYHIPVGLLHTSWGGTVAEAWTSEEGLKEFPHYLSRLQEMRTPEAQSKLMENGKLKPIPNEPTALYNAMITPLIPYAIKGAIWYQGESNANNKKAYEYRYLFPAMIKDWRSNWHQGNFPFLFVQLANFQAAATKPEESTWAELRESQLLTLSLPNTGMAVIHDIGEAKDIHPKNKKDVGIRLALAAEKIAYHDNTVVYSGPVYKSMQIKNDKVYLSFTNKGSGLMANNADTLTQFAISGADKKFVWAHAKIEDDKVVVWSEQVANPAAVRYAWANNAEGCNLYNKEGLPASSFRTDNWLLTSQPK
ncbi:MAG: sialate O-acetylesterase [Segetibacter sp.]|nr:sialate O-acetylesterase [Segetibacter sp.]